MYRYYCIHFLSHLSILSTLTFLSLCRTPFILRESRFSSFVLNIYLLNGMRITRRLTKRLMRGVRGGCYGITQTLNELFNDTVFTCTTRLLVHVRDKTRH